MDGSAPVPPRNCRRRRNTGPPRPTGRAPRSRQGRRRIASTRTPGRRHGPNSRAVGSDLAIGFPLLVAQQLPQVRFLPGTAGVVIHRGEAVMLQRSADAEDSSGPQYFDRRSPKGAKLPEARPHSLRATPFSPASMSAWGVTGPLRATSWQAVACRIPTVSTAQNGRRRSCRLLT